MFYPARGFNHPGVHPPGTRPANYFYYYQQTTAGITPTADGPFYNGTPGSQGTSLTESFATWRYFVAAKSFEPYQWDPIGWPSPPQQEILVPGVNGGVQRQGKPRGLAYIDLFAWAARHERTHHLNSVRFWGWTTPPDPNPLDGERDWLPDAQEPQLGAEAGPYSPSTTDSHPTDAYSGNAGIPDRERHNCNATNAEEWNVGSADSQDWACPGTQYDSN